MNEGVLGAIADAGVDAIEDVHFVQIKCPLLTAQRIAEAERRGAATATRDTLKSMGLSRAASALGVAVALGEVSRGGLSQADIGANFALYSERASTSAGVELVDHEIVVLGLEQHFDTGGQLGHRLVPREAGIGFGSVRRRRAPVDRYISPSWVTLILRVVRFSRRTPRRATGSTTTATAWSTTDSGALPAGSARAGGR